MGITDFDSDRQRAVNRLMGTVAPILWKYLGEKLTAIVIAVMAGELLPHLNSSRQEFRKIARRYYTETIEQHRPGDSAPITEPELSDFTIDQMRGTLEKVFLPDKRVHETPPVTEKKLEQVLIKVAHHAKQAEREATQEHAKRDPRIKGWARFDPIPPTCPLCMLAISRGPVYNRATGQQDFHTGDTCEAVLVVEGAESWEGKDQYEEFLNLYEKVAKGKNYKQALKDFYKEAKTYQRSSNEPGPDRRSAEHEIDKSRPDE